MPMAPLQSSMQAHMLDTKPWCCTVSMHAVRSLCIASRLHRQMIEALQRDAEQRQQPSGRQLSLRADL